MSEHRSVHAAALPKPGGPYSVATVFERLVFVSGQGAKDPRTEQLVGSDIESQTEQCLRNVEAILQAAGSGLQHVLRCGVFLTDITEFQRMNTVYAKVFGENRPARTTIQAAAMYAKGKKASMVKLLVSPMAAFISGYFLKRGFLDGVDGLMIARSVSYQTFAKYAKLLELQRKGGSRR